MKKKFETRKREFCKNKKNVFFACFFQRFSKKKKLKKTSKKKKILVFIAFLCAF
jgi:hypothetical protein